MEATCSGWTRQPIDVICLTLCRAASSTSSGMFVNETACQTNMSYRCLFGVFVIDDDVCTSIRKGHRGRPCNVDFSD